MSVELEPRAARVPLEPRSAPPWPRSVRAVVRRSLCDRRRGVLVWGLSLGGYGALMAAVYPSIRSSINQVIENYPAALKKAFDAGTMNTVEGYIHAEMFSLIVPLAIGYFAIRVLAGATAGAEERGHLDVILALPVSRRVLMLGAYAATAAVALAILLITGLLTFVAGRIAGAGISLGLVTAGAIGTWPFALVFGGVAAVLSGLLHSARAVTGIALGLLIAMYAVDVAGKLSHHLTAIRAASIFKYYGAPMRDGIDVIAFTGLVIAGIVLAVIGAGLFERRDVLH